MNHSTIILSVLLLWGCSTTPRPEATFLVEYKGALKNIMHKGDLSAKASLMDLEQTEHLFGLGAVENLKGEILILDGKAIISSVQADTLNISESFAHNVTLFVYASVENWNSFNIPANISSYDELEEHIENVAGLNGVDIDRPFPFMITGNAKSFDWHVINWKDGDTEHSHDKHIHSGLYGTHTDMDVKILGFYSDSHHAIFTHHTTNMHMHFISADGMHTGHVDGLTLGKGMRLMLPVGL